MRDDERIYPCVQCGKMRTKAEGGTVFTVCDACWDRNVDARTVDALAAVTRERDAAVFKCAEIAERLAAVTMERDEAIADVDVIETALVATRRDLQVALAERDEARAEVARYKSIRDRGYPHKSWDTLILQLADSEKQNAALREALEKTGCADVNSGHPPECTKRRADDLRNGIPEVAATKLCHRCAALKETKP